MGKVKEKCIQCVYEIISESPEIQDLIKKIANGNNLTYSNTTKNDNYKEETTLHMQLNQATKELEQYKQFYVQAKPKLEQYHSLENEMKTLYTENEKLLSKLKSNKSYINNLESDVNTLKEKIEKLGKEKDSISLELKSSNETLQRFKEQFENPIKYLEMYRSLSYSVRSGLENVIIDTNEITFIASCTNENNLSSIWEYIKEISNDTDSDDFKVLNLIFDYFFDVFNNSLSEPKYKRDDVEIGDDLDDDYYDRCYGSATSGEITRVIIKGYKSRNTGKIIHKSLVKA